MRRKKDREQLERLMARESWREDEGRILRLQIAAMNRTIRRLKHSLALQQRKNEKIKEAYECITFYRGRVLLLEKLHKITEGECMHMLSAYRSALDAITDACPEVKK